MVGRRILLAFLFVLPIGLALFLYTSKNHYALPDLDMSEAQKELTIYNPQTASCEGNPKDGVHRIPDFAFLNQDSTTFSANQLNGKIYIANFFFTRCPSICLTMTEQLRRVAEVFDKDPEVKIAGFSVDPEYDSPSKLKEYRQAKLANYSDWEMLTGPSKDIYRLAHCGYFIPAGPNPDVENDFVHSDKFILVDKDSRIRGFYSGTDPKEVDRLIMEIGILKNEY